MPNDVENRPSRGPSTIRDVAALAGVSRQTVSNAINSPARLTSETLSKVLQAIEELDYRPNEAGRSLTSRRSRVIAISLGRTIHDPSASLHPLLTQLVRSAARHDYRIVVLEGGDDVDGELAAYGDIRRRNAADGVVIVDTYPGDPRPDWLAERGIPFAAMGAPWGVPEAQHDWIEIDGIEGMRLVTQHLIDQGHRRIAFIGWQVDHAGGDDRVRGWEQALRASGLAPTDLLRTEADTIEEGQRAARGLLAAHEVTAIVCASDLLAVGASRAIEDLGRRPGTDIAVTGYDDSAMAAYNRPPITSVRQPLDVVADFLVDAVVEASDEHAAPRAQPTHLMIVPQLIVRESSSSAAPTRTTDG